jgi:hypothetical protein
MKFIDAFSNENLKSKHSLESLYDERGNLLDTSESKIFAKMLIIDLGDNETQKQFFVRTYNNTPLDPIGPDSRRDIWRRTELKKVNQSTFDAYLSYLQTRNRLHMTKAQRSYING